MRNSIRDGKIECLNSVSTIADGIAVKEPGEHTFQYVSQYVDEIVTVTDDEISAAILALIERQKLIAEGAGAASVAAAMFNKVPIQGKKTVCLVSGGNIDVTILSRVIKRGLLMSSRTCTLNIELLDKPTIYWDFHSLLLGIQMMFSFLLVDGEKPLRLCKHCQKVFLSSRSNSAFCSPRCKNQYNVYKSRGKNKGQDGENDD